MKIRIRSDGTPHGTEVVDERGVPLEMVSKVEWEVDRNVPVATARVTFIKVPVELVAEVQE